MKKMKTLIFVFTALLFFTCKNDYKCTCGETHSSHDGLNIHDTHRNAKEKCDDIQHSYKDTIQCVLL